jgi:hypothetical protein
MGAMLQRGRLRRLRPVYTILLLVCSVLFSAPREASAVVIPNSNPVIERRDIFDFLDLSYSLLLGRAPDGSALTTFYPLLTEGVDTTTVATEIDTSVEYYSRIVTAYYQKFLKQPPSTTAVMYWVGQMMSGVSDEAVIAALVGSAAYQTAWHITTPAELIDQMFHDLLGRSPAPTEIEPWLALLSASNATTVALDIESSVEYRSDLITQLYQDDLDQTPASVSYFVGLLDSGGTDEQVIAQLVGSAEFLGDAERLGGSSATLRMLEFTQPLTGVPEPPAFWLLAIGMVSLAGLYRFRSAGNPSEPQPAPSLAIGGWKARPMSQGK